MVPPAAAKNTEYGDPTEPFPTVLVVIDTGAFTKKVIDFVTVVPLLSVILT